MPPRTDDPWSMAVFLVVACVVVVGGLLRWLWGSDR